MKRQFVSAALFLAVVLALAISAQSGLMISPASLPIVLVVGQQIPPQQLTTDRSNFDIITWSVSGGNLPPGLVLNSQCFACDSLPRGFAPPQNGSITGIPTQAGVFNFTVEAVDSENSYYFPGYQNYSLSVSTGLPLTLTPQAQPGGAVGSGYASFPFQASGGVPVYTWGLQGGNVDGLTLDSGTGLLSGIPLAGGVFPVTVTVTDPTGAQVSGSFSLNVLGITSASLPAGSLGVPYSQTLTSVGGTGPLTWSVAGTGALPQGLNLSAQGQIAGTPTVYGAFPVQIHVTDTAAQLTATKSFTVNIGNATVLTVTTASLPNGTIGTVYSQTLQAVGGTAPYTWKATGLPSWLQLASTTGILSGTPTAGGTSTLSVTVTDAVGATATASLSLTVMGNTISPATLPNGVAGVPYPATTLAVASAPVPFWTVTVGTLPAGLALNATTGVISGTPTAAGSSTFTITANFHVVTAVVPPVVQAFTVVINPPPSVTITGLPTIGVAATQPAATVSLSGGTYPLNIGGTLNLAFTPASGPVQPYDAKFANVLLYTAPFTIAAGSTQGLFAGASSVPVIIGTVAGTITITTTNLVDSSGNALTPPAPVVITVNPTVPVITKVTFGAVNNGTFTVLVTGRSTTRDMTSALFHFALPTTTTPSTLDVTVPSLTSAFAAWYSNPNSIGTGSTFTATFQFSFTGPVGSTVPFTAVTVTMTNSVGASNAFGPTNP